MFLDITTHIQFEGNDRNAQVSFSLLEAFAGPAQSPRVDVPPSAAVSASLAGVKRRVDTVPSVLAHCKRNGSSVTEWNDGQLAKIEGRISGRRVRIILRRILLIKVVAAPTCQNYLHLKMSK
jgi:hypothetical protein